MERRVLFVEDDANFRNVFTRLMREGGLDAALIDVTMPDGDGLELVGETHDGGPGDHIPTLVLTASLETSVAGRAMEAGAQGAFSKIASVPETAGAIMRLIESRSSEA